MSEWLRFWTCIARHDVAISDQLVLVNQQPLHSNRSTGMSLIRADADFRAEAVAESIGETRGCVPVNTRGVDFVQETARVFTVFGHDAVRMRRTVLMNVVDRF